MNTKDEYITLRFEMVRDEPKKYIGIEGQSFAGSSGYILGADIITQVLITRIESHAALQSLSIFKIKNPDYKPQISDADLHEKIMNMWMRYNDGFWRKDVVAIYDEKAKAYCFNKSFQLSTGKEWVKIDYFRDAQFKICPPLEES